MFLKQFEKNPLSILLPVVALVAIFAFVIFGPWWDERPAPSSDVQADNDDGGIDTGFVTQEQDLGNDPDMIASDTGAFGLDPVDTGLASLFVPIPNPDPDMEFIPRVIDEALLPDPPHRFEPYRIEPE